jgi:hypothetical protein
MSSISEDGGRNTEDRSRRALPAVAPHSQRAEAHVALEGLDVLREGVDEGIRRA